jgi:2-polyprenyl-3-methyl-5-hydroxy-6-metoxy-1,4-benzoquinol methylase/spore coat polysaccharide biosynthesis predicted glycosyltransferase SpsG
MKIIIVPAYGHGRGGGHLCRCLSLTGDLRAMDREALFFLPTDAPDISGLYAAENFNSAWRITENDLGKIYANTVECIVLDRFQTPPEELARWKEIAPVIGIDEGGSSRGSFDFLIDILIPEKMARIPANISSPSLLRFPENIKPKKAAQSPAPRIAEDAGSESPADSPVPAASMDKKLKILISFGQEDSARLGYKLALSLSTLNDNNIDITWLKGGLGKKEDFKGKTEKEISNVTVLDVIPNLAEKLGEYDLVITHYGITAYEALYTGSSVLLASPTSYHKKLAGAAGFKLINLKKPKGIRQIFDPRYSDAEKLKKYCEELAARHSLGSRPDAKNAGYHPKKEGSALAVLVNSFSPMVNQTCPVCGQDAPENALARFNDRTYRRCERCSAIFMDRTCPPPIEYEKEYFFEFYKNQYGKTYIEDFPNLIAMAKRRLKIIKELTDNEISHGASPPSLLDIGCAYGPFLAAARDEGFLPAGIDAAEDAVRYVSEELEIPAAHGFFPNCRIPKTGNGAANSAIFDVITLWYVIEHFNDCVAVLSEIKKILKPAGLIAFSTPSYSGISGRRSLKKFLSKSPGDHFTVWSPRMCRKLRSKSANALSLAGFTVKKIVVTGHHPERFPLLGRFAGGRKSPFYWLLLALSKVLGLGDTFEVYARAAKDA